jgi:hypothetical protein
MWRKSFHCHSRGRRARRAAAVPSQRLAAEEALEHDQGLGLAGRGVGWGGVGCGWGVGGWGANGLDQSVRAMGIGDGTESEGLTGGGGPKC